MSNYRITEIQRLAEMFKALSNPHRLVIFLRLLSCCPPGSCVTPEQAWRYVGQLGAELNVVPSTVSHHIKELRQAGIVKVERRGKNIECSVDLDAVVALVDLLMGRTLDGLDADPCCGKAAQQGG